MQYVPVEIMQIIINSELRISLREHSGSIPRNSYIIQSLENEQWKEKNKSYIEKLKFDNQIMAIEKWVNKTISIEDVKEILK